MFFITQRGFSAGLCEKKGGKFGGVEGMLYLCKKKIYMVRIEDLETQFIAKQQELKEKYL